MPHHFSFSGCGFLGVYHLGVAACLKQHVSDLLEDCKIAGASAGAFVACCLLTGCSIDKCTRYVLDLVSQAESQPILGPLHPRFKLISGLQESMQQILPADAYKLASGRLFISLTRYKDLQNVIVSEYASNDELISALLCSGFVPFYCGIIPPRYKGDYYWDGGLSDNQPVFEEPTITVSPFSGETDICPSDNSSNFIHLNICNSSVQFTQENLHRVSIALFPPKSITMSEICQQGYNDTLRYLQKNGMVNCIYHLNVPMMPYFQGTETEAEELSTEENPEEEPHFDCRECKHNIRKTLFSSLPPVLLKVFHSTMTSKDQSILKYIFQGKLFQAMSLMITSFIAPVDILWACFTSFLSKIPQRPKDFENILNQLSFLFLCFIHFLYKLCKHNKQCTVPVECMDSAYSFYYFNHMDDAIRERICQNNKKCKDNNDSSSNPNIIPSNCEVKVENLETSLPRKILTDCKECYCCHHSKDGRVTNCTVDQCYHEIFLDSIKNKLGNEKMPSTNNNKLRKSKTMKAHEEQNNQTSLLNIKQDTPMANKRLFERSQSYPFCKSISDNKKMGFLPISTILNKIENMEAKKSQYLSKSTENCSNMFEAFVIDPLLSSQMRTCKRKKFLSNKACKGNEFMEASKGNNAYICEVDSIAVNDSIDDIYAGGILGDWDQELRNTSVALQTTKNAIFEANKLSSETVFVNPAEDQIIPDIFNSSTESSIDLNEHGKPLDISQAMSKSMEGHFDSFNDTVFVKCRKGQITSHIFNDLTESSSNLKKYQKYLANSQTSESMEAHTNSFDNKAQFVNCTKGQTIYDERFLKRCCKEQSDTGFLERSLINLSLPCSEIKNSKHSLDFSDTTLSTSLDTYLKYMNKDTVFLNYGKNCIPLNHGFLQRSLSDQSGFKSNRKKHAHTFDTSRMTRSLSTHFECPNNEAVFANYNKHNSTTGHNFRNKALQRDHFESNSEGKEYYIKLNTGSTNASPEQKSQLRLSKFIENNCKPFNSEISNYRTVHTPCILKNHTKATMGIPNDLDKLQTSDTISSVRESISTSRDHLVRHISIEHI